MPLTNRFRCRLDPGAGYILATVLLIATFVACELATARNVIKDEPLAPLAACPECLCPVPDCPGPPPKKAPSGPIDLNSATLAELQSISGIGPSMAQKIIDYRTRRPFRKTRDLMRVRGIGPRTYRQIAPHLHITNTKDQERAR